MAIINPIVDLNRGFRIWNIDEIYTGPTENGRYVPNVDDGVWDWNSGMLRVVNVNINTGISTLAPWVAPNKPENLTELDTLLGNGPGMVSETYRLYINKSVNPHTIACDAKLYIKGSNSSIMKIFYGHDTTENGRVISKWYDQDGVYVSDNVPLEVIAMDDINNHAIKAPGTAYTTDDLADGDIVTAVIYDDNGYARSINALVVKSSTFVRSPVAPALYITHIELQSPYLSKTASTTLEAPLGLTINSLSLIGVAHYNSGLSMEYPIDGTKFSLHGLDNYITTLAGQQLPLVLTYKLADNEVAYDAANGEVTHISKNYELITLPASHAYNLKLYAYPVWVNDSYTLRYYLSNLDREPIVDVTEYIETDITTNPVFDGIKYGDYQDITVAIDVYNVNPQWLHYRHIQTVTVILHGPATYQGTCWEMGFEGINSSFYGTDVIANARLSTINSWSIDLTSRAMTTREWLNRLYLPILPLYDSETEVSPPDPTHYIISYGDITVERSIDQWNEFLTVDTLPKTGDILTLTWVCKNPTADLYLGISGVMVRLL